MDNIVNLVFILDDGYAMPTGVALYSLKENRLNNVLYNIYIIYSEINDYNKQKLLKLRDDNFEIILTKTNQIANFHGLSKNHTKVTTTSLYKFLIPEILQNIDKVIYIDGDVIIQDDLVNLFEVELGNKYAAVVKDGPRKKILNGGKKHRFSVKPTYFNSGVMLLNLKMMRQERITEKLIEYRISGYNYFMDQDAFNIILENNVLFLPYFYNLLLHILTPIWKLNTPKILSEFYDIKPIDNIDQYFEKAKIIHYTFAKPWRYYDIPQSEKWLSYFKKSTFSDVILNRKSYLINYHNSLSYKIGQVITYIPKKVKLLIKRKK